jgi:hypothetical protein
VIVSGLVCTRLWPYRCLHGSGARARLDASRRTYESKHRGSSQRQVSRSERCG